MKLYREFRTQEEIDEQYDSLTRTYTAPPCWDTAVSVFFLYRYC